MGLFSSLKDNISSFSGEQIVRSAVEKYGELQGFKINSSAKTIYIKLLPRGEKEPVEINVNRYSVEQSSGRMFVRIHDLKASKEWITLLANDFLIKEKFEVPQKYASIVSKFL